MDLKILQEFMYLSKDLSFTKTAERCFVSQPVLSRHIKALEDELGCKLVVRDKTGLRLTPYGKAFAQSCKAIDAAYAEGLSRLDNIREGFTEVLRVAYVTPLASAFIDDAYRIHLQERPSVRLELLASWEERTIVLLSQEKVDMSIFMVFEEPDPSVYSSMKLFDDGYVLVMPLDHRLAKRESASMHDLEDETVLIPSNRDYPAQYSRIMEVFSRHPGAHAHAALCNKHDVLALSEAGRGIALARSQALCDMDLSRVRVIPLHEEALDFEIRAVWRTDNESPNLCGFVEILAQVRDSRSA